ncbi:MAG: HAD hydrolase-like protein [Gammaproteobacteria bacterium]|nr:HAD hydrolase-like protein [Gammaproteobacteria bacterium]MCY4228598.1 HAD hydrolase-like protein [Gammaproteobacteria bacterium]
MKSYRLLVFDWDGTLMDSRDKIVNCFIGAAHDYCIVPPEPDQAAQLIGLSILESFSRLYPKNSPELNMRLMDSYGEYWRVKDKTPMVLFDGVREGLDRLRQAEYLLSIATGKSKNGLQKALQETGLAGCFAYTRCGDQGQPKPHPEMLQKTLAYTGIASHEAVMIGDTTFDLEMAAGACMDGWGVTYGSHSREQLEDLSTLGLANSFSDIVEILC